MSDAELSQFCSITSASPNQAKKYLSRFPTFEGAVESFLENPEKSPIRPPDQPFNDILIDSPEKKKLIKDTTLEKGRRLKQRIQEQQNEFISRGKVSRDLKQQDVDCLSRISNASSFDQAKKRGLVLRRLVLISFYDGSFAECKNQTTEIWNSNEFSSILKDNVIFYQNSIASEDYKEFTRVYRMGKTIRNDQWPHAALVDPRTGALVQEFFGEEAADKDRFFDRFSNLINKNCSDDFGEKISKKRNFDQITDQTEDEQLAIAIAASIKSASKKQRSTKKIAKDKEPEIFDEPEMNSDFESVSEGESEDEDTRESFSNEPELAALVAIDERQEVTDENNKSTPIRFQIRTPENKRHCIEMLRSEDASTLRLRLLSLGFCLTQYELIRAYPKEVMDLSEGRNLVDLKIVNQDSFLLQKKI